MLIKVTVSKESILKGRCCSPTACAIALTVAPFFDWVSVGEAITARVGGEFIRINLPHKAHTFIENFDMKTPEQRAAMQPISFEIEVPDSIIDKIGILQVNEILSKSETLTRVEI